MITSFVPKYCIINLKEELYEKLHSILLYNKISKYNREEKIITMLLTSNNYYNSDENHAIITNYQLIFEKEFLERVCFKIFDLSLNYHTEINYIYKDKDEVNIEIIINFNKILENTNVFNV